MNLKLFSSIATAVALIFIKTADFDPLLEK